MSEKTVLKPLAIAASAAFVTTLASTTVANAAANPFAMNDLSGGYMVAENATDTGEEGMKTMEGGMKTMEEGKCGGEKKTMEEGESGAGMKTMEEGKCGEGKCGAGKKTAE